MNFNAQDQKKSSGRFFSSGAFFNDGIYFFICPDLCFKLLKRLCDLMIEEILDPSITDVVRDFFDIEKFITHVGIDCNRLLLHVNPSGGTHDEWMRIEGVIIVGNGCPNEVLS